MFHFIFDTADLQTSNSTDIEFMCSSGMQTIVASARCDGTIDCHDYSDEIDCGGDRLTLNYITFVNNSKFCKAKIVSSVRRSAERIYYFFYILDVLVL